MHYRETISNKLIVEINSKSLYSYTYIYIYSKQLEIYKAPSLILSFFLFSSLEIRIKIFFYEFLADEHLPLVLELLLAQPFSLLAF